MENLRVAFLEKYVDGERHVFMLKFLPGEEFLAVAAIQLWVINEDLPFSHSDAAVMIANIASGPSAV